MADHSIESVSRHELILSLLAGEILTRKGELGPLARVFVPRMNKRTGEIPRASRQHGEGQQSADRLEDGRGGKRRG